MMYIHAILRWAAIGIAVAAAAGCRISEAPNAQEHLENAPEAVREFVAAMNAHRKDLGLDTLTWSPELAAVAVEHSEDMHDRGFFSHTNPDREDPFDRMRNADISFRSAGENIARGYPSGSAVLSGWLASDGHRANIQNGNFTHHGVGYVEDGHYWTHVFARTPTVP